MKRFLTLILAALMVFTLVSCGGGTGTSVNTKSILDIGDFTYEFKGYELVKDEYGTDVILLCYDFTNKSEDDCAFFASGFYEAVQTEETLNATTIYVSEESMEAVTDAEMEEIAPGETLEVKIAYELIDTTSPVTMNFASITTGKEVSHTVDITAPVSSVPATDDKKETATTVEAIGELGDSEWYGWWMVTDATGDFEEYDGAYFDCCVNFEPTSEGYTLMSIWDEVYTDYNENCIGEIYLEYYDDLGYMSVGGYFLTGDDIASDGQVTVIPDITEIENTLFTTIPVEAENGGFTATLFLTEWGYEWDEELGEYPTYYDSYFLPLMEDGESLPANLDDIG